MPGPGGQKKDRPLPGELAREGRVCLWLGLGDRYGEEDATGNGDSLSKGRWVTWEGHTWEEGAAPLSQVCLSSPTLLIPRKGEHIPQFPGTKKEITNTFSSPTMCVTQYYNFLYIVDTYFFPKLMNLLQLYYH